MMTDSECLEFEDSQLDDLKSAKSRSSVLKMSVLSARSQATDIPVFVFEGVDDKAVYSQWIRRIRPGLEYEPLPSDGKDQALSFWDSLLKDKDGLIENVYVFVDRDFDDLKGRETHSRLFMTDFYAVENYVVCDEVLEDILKNELHCHGEPKIRAEILGVFRDVYRSYLDVITNINFRIFCARKLKVDIDNLPKKISKLAVVSLEEISSVGDLSDEFGVLARELTAGEVDEMQALFGKLDPPTRFRGKFLLLFFLKWLELLSIERVKKNTPMMEALSTVTKVGSNFSTLGSLASRSPMPTGLGSFLSQVAS